MDVSPFPVQDRFTFPDASKSIMEAIYEIRNADLGGPRYTDAPPEGVYMLSLVTDWKLSSISATKWAGITFLLKFGTGVVPLEFTNTSTGAVEMFDAGFLAAGWSLPISWSSTLFTTPWLSMQGTQVITSPSAPSPFPIGNVRKNFGAIVTLGGTASSAGYILFSYVPLTPIAPGGLAFLGGVFAGCAFTVPATMYGTLSAGVLSFRVD